MVIQISSVMVLISVLQNKVISLLYCVVKCILLCNRKKLVNRLTALDGGMLGRASIRGSPMLVVAEI